MGTPCVGTVRVHLKDPEPNSIHEIKISVSDLDPDMCPGINGSLDLDTD